MSKSLRLIPTGVGRITNAAILILTCVDLTKKTISVSRNDNDNSPINLGIQYTKIVIPIAVELDVRFPRKRKFCFLLFTSDAIKTIKSE